MTGKPNPEIDAVADPGPRPDSGQIPKRQVTLTLIGVTTAAFLAAMNQMIVVTAMPSIVAELGGFDLYSWATASYLLAATVSVPIVGRLSDVYGRRRLFILGVGLFMLAALPAAASQSMPQLIAFRALQGVGGGIISICCVIAIADLFPPDERGKYQGVLGAVYGLAAIFGPVLGGFITENLSWSWVFYVNIPLSVPVLLLLLLTYPRIAVDRGDEKLDYGGMVLLLLAATPILFALAAGGNQFAWNSWPIVGCLAFGAAMAVAFVIVEIRAESPIMPIGIYRRRSVAGSTLAMLLVGFGLYGGTLLLPLYLEVVLGVSAESAGLFLTPLLMGVLVGVVFAGQALSRLRGHYRRVAVISTGLATAGMYMFTWLDESSGDFEVVPIVAVLGLGVGGAMATFNVAVQNTVPFSLLGVATSAVHFFRSTGGMLGTALLGGVMVERLGARFSETALDAVAAVLGSDRLADLQDSPHAILDSAALDALSAEVAASGADGEAVAEALRGSLASALSGALGDAFTVGAVALALSVAASLLLDPHVSSPSTPERAEAGNQGRADSV